MELVSFDVDGFEFFIGYKHAFGVVGIVEFSANSQPSARFGAGDEIDNDLMTDQWTPTPVHRNKREQAVFYLVPLAGARRKMADQNVQARLLSESTEFEFPQTHAMPVAAATISGDDQLFGLWIVSADPILTQVVVF